MGRSRFPAKPLKFQNRKRISVLTGAVYNAGFTENIPIGDVGASTNVFTGEKEEEEKKEDNQDSKTNVINNANKVCDTEENIDLEEIQNSDSAKSSIRTRSQNKMDPVKIEKSKPVKKTVTFGTVESCEDIFIPFKKVPLKNHAPLVSIIKKKSALKPAEYTTFNSILKPAKLTDLSSKSSDHHEGYLKKSMNKFSHFTERRCLSPPPPLNTSPDRDGGSHNKFGLLRSHSSRVIKPNKRFLDNEEQVTNQSSNLIGVGSGKVLKKPKLKRLTFNNLLGDEDMSKDNSDRLSDKVAVSCNLFKDKPTKSFSSLNGNRKPIRDLFSNERDTDYSQDENSNLEGLDKSKTSESHKDDRGGHALRKLMDISDASTTGSSSSESESEESWDSENSDIGSENEVERSTPFSPERDRAPSSQLLSGKVIIREARLQLSSTTPPPAGQEGPFSSFFANNAVNPPTTVTCGVCGAVRFYRFVKQARKFGIYSCESCRKFISKMIKKEKTSQTSGPMIIRCIKAEGNCRVPPVIRSQQWKLVRCANRARCPACWLKLCLKAFQVPPNIKAGLTAMLPTYMRAGVKTVGSLTQANPLRSGTGNSGSQAAFSVLTNSDQESKGFSTLRSTKKSSEDALDKTMEKPRKERKDHENVEVDPVINKKRRLTRVKVRKKDKGESKKTNETKRQKVELKGPRVKHVCRSASIVLGQPIATFPTHDEKLDKRDKVPAVSGDEQIFKVSQLEKEISVPDQCNTCDDNSENNVPELLRMKDADIIQSEIKKRKTESAFPSKSQNKTDSSEDETSLEIVPRKMALKPFANITNHIRGRPQKCIQSRPDLICVDFWESYDPDEVCSSGFGLIGTASFTVAQLCFLCGSAGKEKMLVCVSCCEWYHSWCAEEPTGMSTGSNNLGGWMCGRCVSCAACGRSAARLRCRSCAGHYHSTCLPTAPPNHRSDWPQICSKCLKCKSCDSNRVSKFVGSLPFCSPCFKLRQKGNYCPLCQACYRDNDFDSKMMECGWCARWVHASCEGLSGEGYQLLSALPPSIEYICRQCMPHDPPWRQMLTEHLKGRLLHLLKLLAKNKKACALLKLTPHKNTPVPNKSFRLMPPQTIRKLHFDSEVDYTIKNTTETKVYRNTARGKKTPSLNKSPVDVSNHENIWQCSSIFNEVNLNEESIPHTSHKVVNLQEPLMQNKEICFSTGLYGTKTEFDTPCVEVHENNPLNQEIKSEQSTLLPAIVHVDKYEPISDDDEPNRDIQSPACSEQELSPVIVRQSTTENIDQDGNNDSINVVSPSLLEVKKRVYSDEYLSLKDFNHDMKEVIERTLNGDLKSIYKDLFTETFPWFDCESNCLQPDLEVDYDQDDVDIIRDQEMTDFKRIDSTKHFHQERMLDQIVPKIEADESNVEDYFDFGHVTDSRTCILCKSVGEGLPAMEARLLYCGQNDWIHANCALWSAEVFEEIDGSLQNVHSAISRGKMIRCAACDSKGASVGCCAKNCSETYHYTCARKEGCAFLDDKRVFCPNHGKEIPKKSLQKDSDFELTRAVYVELDKKKKRYSEISKVQFLLGSLSVNSLGKIVPSVSDYEEYLMPVDYNCSRIFWSTKKPLKMVKYTIRTKLILAEPLPGFDFGVNITVDHSMNTQVVDRLMAEIGAWHESLEISCTTSLMHKDKSPMKFGVGLSLEDLAVKQVLDHLIDTVCKQEQQDEEEPQNTADLLPPELKDAIFEDLNHDLLDGISMQDIFPKLMSYEDLVVMDIKNEFSGIIGQSDDRSIDKTDSRCADFIDELLNARLESGNKELKRSKSEMLIQNHNLKLTTGRGQQRSSSLTWNNKFDTNLISSTIKRCKMNRTSTITGKLSPVQRQAIVETALDATKEAEQNNESKKCKKEVNDNICDDTAHTSCLNSYQNNSHKTKETETANDKSDKTEGYYVDVIDFYTKIQCSPISQLDGACDWSSSESTCSSRPNSPQDDESEFSPISQLDGADENNLSLGDMTLRNQNQFLFRASGTESSYTVTIAGNGQNGQSELIMRQLNDESIHSGVMEQLVRCDRCQCTYRNKESYDRHVPSCDMISTSESESENPKSPESRTLTTLQNAFQTAFTQPMIIHTGVVSSNEGVMKGEGISARRTSINTRQITINGTIVETSSPGPPNEMTVVTEQVKSGTLTFDHNKPTNIEVSGGQVLSSPQIVVTPQMLLPSKTSTAASQKLPHLITQQANMLPYNICVKSGGGNTNIQQLQNTNDMTQLISGSGGIQVLSSNPNQILTIPPPQNNITPIIQGKNHISNFPNMASASSIAVPVNSIQSMPHASIIQNIHPMIRPQMQGNPTIVVPAMTTQRLASPNSQNRQFIINAPQKSPKKQPAVQPKPIFQAANRGRGRPIPKPTTIKRQTKLEKTFTINQSPLGAGNTVIQLQTNNQTGQPSIIVQPMSNQNIMSAYVEALSQQQNQNMQYIATIAPQNDFKTGPTQFISQGGLVPQTFQIQQTESGGLVAVPSGGIPVLLQQGNVGILPQAIQQGATILPQGALQTQGILSQGPNGATIIPQTIHTQNGATIIPQGTIQNITPGITSQTATLLPNNTLQTAGTTVVPHSGIGNTQTLLPNATLQSQGNTLISSAPGTTILPQGALLPQGMQFCNDQVILGSAPTLEMVTDPSGCMYLTTTPVYYGLETIVQNTVMSSQQFVSTAMQGVLAQNSSFSATTTQVFQASKIEPIVEVPAGYVVVNNVNDGVTQQTGSTTANIVGQQVTSQTNKNNKTPIPNLTLQPLTEKGNNNRQIPKVVQMFQSPISVPPQSGGNNVMGVRSNINPITSQVHNMSISSTTQNMQKSVTSKTVNMSMVPNVTLVSSIGQPVMAISHSVPNSVGSTFSVQSVQMPQPIISSSIAPSNINIKNGTTGKLESAHLIEIGSNLNNNSTTSSIPTISVTQSIRSPTWRHMNQISNAGSSDTSKVNEPHITMAKNSISLNPVISAQSNTVTGRLQQINHSDAEKMMHNCIGPINVNNSTHQYESLPNVSQHSVHVTSNNVIQISSGNIYAPSSASLDTDTAMKLNKLNALSKAEGGHLNFSQEIMSSHLHHVQNDKVFQHTSNNEKVITEGVNNHMNMHNKLNSCQISNTNNNSQTISMIPHSVMRPQQMQSNSTPMTLQSSQNQNILSNNGQSNLINNGNASMPNLNISCQASPNNKVNITVTNDNTMQHNDGITSGQIHSTNLPQGNMQIISHDNHHSQPNQIHIMNGQIQHNRSPENNIQQSNNMMNQMTSNRQYQLDNIASGHLTNQANLSNRMSSDTNTLMNQSPNMLNLGNSHNQNRSQSDLAHMHMQQQMSNLGNMQNNRMIVDNNNMQIHQMNILNHQMHTGRSMERESIQSQGVSHNVSQMNHHINNRHQLDTNNMHMNLPMPIQTNRQVESGMHHQHPAPNTLQIQNNRPHIENPINMHHHLSSQMHSRQQIESNVHMSHHMSNNIPNIGMNNQIDGSGNINQNMSGHIHNSSRHNETNNMGLHNINMINQMQNNRPSLDLMQQQMSNVNTMNLHNNMNNQMQMNAPNNQTMNSPMLHATNIPDIKNELQSSCSGSCANPNNQFTNNQVPFDMPSTPAINSNSGLNINTGNMMQNMNINNSTVSNNMMLNNMSTPMYGGNHQNNINNDILMNCNNSSDHNLISNSSMMTNSTNHMIVNTSQSHTNGNQNQMMNNQVVNNTQLNLNNMNMNANNAQHQMTPRSLGDHPKFSQEPLRGKGMMGAQITNNLGPIQTATNTDCAKVNMLNNDKTAHTISLNNQLNYMQMGSQNRIINLPERSRIPAPTIEGNINQHVPQQHNIHVVTNTNNNVGNLNSDNINFQQRNDPNSTMINVPIQAIPNSAPMNINVNSSNNTVNITVQNNLVDPKIASKANTEINFPIPSNSNLLQNQNNPGNLICLPIQNNTINLPTQNSSCISLPKAPPTQQSGIPTNVVTPMSMRPMNRVLPLHRDGQTKSAPKTPAPPKTPTPPQTQGGHDMPELNIKDENVDSDLEKAIEESKRMMELERVKREKEEEEATRAIQLSAQIEASIGVNQTENISSDLIDTETKNVCELPNLDVEMEVVEPKVLSEKNTNLTTPESKVQETIPKITKRPIEADKKETSEVVIKKQNKILRGQENICKSVSSLKPNPDPPKDDGPKLIYEVMSDDGFNYSSTSLTDLWENVLEAIQNSRQQIGLEPIKYNLPQDLFGAHLLGFNNNALRYLIEQLPGASRCTKYKVRHGRQLCSWDSDLDLREGFKESPWGSARIGPVFKKHNHDMFSWMASPFREEPPATGGQDGENVISRRLATLPLAMRFRHLKETSRASVGVYKSHIHGRGLFCKRDIEEGDMVIEYAGEVIRAVLADQREKRYEAMRGRRGVPGCYMFRIDDNLVVDATLKGNAARFINHSCDPNCYSRVVDIHGHKHILIFALRRIMAGEELTYDYKFPFEEVKIPCTCGAKKCRKYLN